MHPGKLSVRYEGGIKNFPEKQKLREFTAIRPALPGTLLLETRRQKVIIL